MTMDDDDEALLIDFVPPDCDNWNFQLNNYWMESLDYRYFPVCINKSSAKTDQDGKVKIVISHKNPGVPNWLNTCSHREGTMCLRWYRPKTRTNLKEPNCSIVKLSDIATDEKE